MRKTSARQITRERSHVTPIDHVYIETNTPTTDYIIRSDFIMLTKRNEIKHTYDI